MLTAIAAVLCVKRDTTLYGTLNMHSPVCMLLEANSDLHAKTCIISFFTFERNLTRLVTKESIHPPCVLVSIFFINSCSCYIVVEAFQYLSYFLINDEAQETQLIAENSKTFEYYKYSPSSE